MIGFLIPSLPNIGLHIFYAISILHIMQMAHIHNMMYVYYALMLSAAFGFILILSYAIEYT